MGPIATDRGGALGCRAADGGRRGIREDIRRSGDHHGVHRRRGADHFPPFPRNGKYVVSGQAIGFVRGENQLALMPGLNRADFTLASTEAILPQMSGWQQLAMLPEDSREDRRGKALITRVCSNCHQTSRIFARKFD